MKANYKNTIDNRDLLATYQQTKSVWRTGAIHGIAGQTVHKRLRKSGLMAPKPPEFSGAQIAEIRAYYLNTPTEIFDLKALAAKIGKRNTSIAREALAMGLTDKCRPGNAETIRRCLLTHKDQWKDREHPRGYLGHKHGAETRKKISEKSKLSWVTAKTFNIGMWSPEHRLKNSERMKHMAATRPAHQSYSRAKGGYREDLGKMYFRSSWEANYARYLNLLIKFGVVESWEYEAQTFWFGDVKRGTNSYRPDFKIKYKGDDRPEWVEIKGWVTPKDKTKWRRMAKYHPDVKLIVVGEKQYYAIRDKWSRAIPTWEYPSRLPPKGNRLAIASFT